MLIPLQTSFHFNSFHLNVILFYLIFIQHFLCYQLFVTMLLKTSQSVRGNKVKKSIVFIVLYDGLALSITTTVE